jgi:hypothetical protein
MSDTMTDIHKGWYQGIAFALAEVARLHDEPQLVVDVMSNTGLMLTDLAEAGAAEEDMDEIWKCLRLLMLDGLYSDSGALLMASLLVLVALWVQIRHDLKTNYLRGFASSLATSIRHGAGSAVVQSVMQHHAVRLSDLDRRGVAKQDLATIRQCVEASA